MLARAWEEQRGGVIALSVALLALVLVGITIVDRVVHRGEVLPGVRVGGRDLSAATERDALREVRAMAHRLTARPLRARAGPTLLSVDPSALGLRVDAVATVRAARTAGRSPNPLDAVAGTVLRRIRDDDVPLSVHVDDQRFAGVLDGWLAVTSHGLVDGGLRVEGTRVVEVPPHGGIGIRRAEARAAVLAALRHGRDGVVALPFGAVSPAVDRNEIRRAASRARRLLARPVAIDLAGTIVALTPEQLATTLTTEVRHSRLELAVDPARLRVVLAPPLSLLEALPKDASFAVDGARVSIVPAVVGRRVDLDRASRQLAAGRPLASAPFRAVPPARTTEWAQRMNINELVSTFSTYHSCCEPRVTNIHVAADTIDNTVVEPGHVFSLNEALGPRRLDKGYVSAPAIGPDLGLEPDVGGGVSQLSTTLYNAVFFGCYQDVTHTVHALYISRYPMGREATLNYPSIDNQFRNDSHSGVLIRTSYTPTSITVSLYGNKEGRTCRAEGPHVLQTIPPTTTYVDDLSLPAGTERVIEAGHTGYVVENLRIISRPGQPDRTERYVERYAMAPTKVARGTAPVPSAPALPASPP